MTERLSTLLHDEATALDVPPPTTTEILARGRGLQRRRRATYGAAGLALAAVVAAGIVLGTGGDDGPTGAIDPAGPPSTPATGAVFSVGNTVYLDDGATTATIDDTSVKSLYYTSVGVLVRHGNNPYSDGGGPQRFSLVTPDGTVTPISVVTEETVHSTDPTQPYLAYAETKGVTTDVVVHDLRDDSEAARIALPSGLTWGGWPAPPVALSGDIVYVGTEDTMRAVNWRTGEITEVDTVAPGYPDIHGGRAVGNDEKDVTVVDVASGETLLTVPLDGFGFANLSPDGRFAKVESGMDPGAGVDVYDVESGAKVRVKGEGFGWTPDDRLFSLRNGKLSTCSPTTGECSTQPVDLAVQPDGSNDPEDFSDDLKLGGMTYES